MKTKITAERKRVPTTGPMDCYAHMIDGLITFSKRDDGSIAEVTEILEAWGNGCTELYSELGEYAVFCDFLCQAGLAKYDECPGVYDYEVSFEFGGWFGTHILSEGGAPTPEECFDKLEELATKFFGRFEPRVCEVCNGLGVVCIMDRGQHRIQMCDNCNEFTSDSAAILHVFNRFAEAQNV